MDQRAESPQPEVNNPAGIQERGTSKVKITEGIRNIVSFLRKPTTQENPDAALLAIAGGIPTENNSSLSEESSQKPEDAEQLRQANQLLETFVRIRDILAHIKDNELASGAVVAGIGIIAALAGAPSELGMAAEIASVGITMGGTTQEKMKNVATGVAGFAVSQGLGHLPLGGHEHAALDMAMGFSDVGVRAGKEIGRTAIERVGQGEKTRRIVNNARNRMTPRTKLVTETT